MSEPFIAEIRMVGFNFAPRGWAFCDGQLLPIAQNTALFSLIGTIYGGDGRTTTALPDLRARSAMHTGSGPGLTPRQQGESGGQPAVALAESQLPAHDHALRATASPTATSPGGAALSATANGSRAYRIPGATAPMAPQALASAGGGAPHNNRQPYLGVHFCIALQGLYPSRS